MRSDLLNLWCLRKFLELVESNGEIGAWGLVDWLIAHHVKFLLQITAPARWAMYILVAATGHLGISTTLAINVLRQARVALVESFTIPSGAVMADVEDHASNPGGKVGQVDAVFVEPPK
jgi:hypothetical protein